MNDGAIKNRLNKMQNRKVSKDEKKKIKILGKDDPSALSMISELITGDSQSLLHHVSFKNWSIRLYDVLQF